MKQSLVLTFIFSTNSKSLFFARFPGPVKYAHGQYEESGFKSHNYQFVLMIDAWWSLTESTVHELSVVFFLAHIIVLYIIDFPKRPPLCFHMKIVSL